MMLRGVQGIGSTWEDRRLVAHSLKQNRHNQELQCVNLTLVRTVHVNKECKNWSTIACLGKLMRLSSSSEQTHSALASTDRVDFSLFFRRKFGRVCSQIRGLHTDDPAASCGLPRHTFLRCTVSYVSSCRSGAVHMSCTGAHFNMWVETLLLMF